MKIVITGCAGFIGTNLAKKLIELGHQVVGIDNFLDNYSSEIKEVNAKFLNDLGVSLYRADLSVDDVSEKIIDVDYIFHLAAQPGLSKTVSFDDYVKNNIIATHKMLKASRKIKNLKLFVYGSTSSIYGLNVDGDETTTPQPASNYGVTKLAAEQLVLSYYRQYNLPVCSLRLFSVYGPRERPEKLYPQLINSILYNSEFNLFEGSLNHSRSYTYIDDIIDGMILVMNQTEKVLGEIFNIGSDVEYLNKDTISIVEELMKEKTRIIIKSRRPGDQLHTRANIEKARKILGYDPKVTIREGLQKEINWFRELRQKNSNVFID
ncbi:MAG: GDP-mannose 4,6-dehydratase [Candidatus Heimdallarchaeota archaeon]|nr:GDP-mannose 4,6-dehydratase [Candidatus Heimdallarchaeota archaeon]MDH5644762.1 GDP-mannose 4,6-dehydratase [Candidatus Heimdallarchaeota archaeon]